MGEDAPLTFELFNCSTSVTSGCTNSLAIQSSNSGCVGRAPLTPQSNAMRDRLADQARQDAVDPALQDKWDRLHRRSLYLNFLVLIAGLCLVALAREL